MPSAFSQTAVVGDLVEIVSGLGPTLAEIVVGPDASGYVVIQLPTGIQVPVNTQKLRLVQKAGTPNASIAVGAAVGWVDAHIVEKGSVDQVALPLTYRGAVNRRRQPQRLRLAATPDESTGYLGPSPTVSTGSARSFGKG